MCWRLREHRGDRRCVAARLILREKVGEGPGLFASERHRNGPDLAWLAHLASLHAPLREGRAVPGKGTRPPRRAWRGRLIIGVCRAGRSTQDGYGPDRRLRPALGAALRRPG